MESDLGAAAGGFVAGAIAGAFTGDVSAAAVVGIGMLAGGAGAATNSLVQQGTDSYIQTGSVQIGWGQVARDTAWGAAGGGIAAGAGYLLPRVAGAVLDDLSNFIFPTPPPLLANGVALPLAISGQAGLVLFPGLRAGVTAGGAQIARMAASSPQPAQYNAQAGQHSQARSAPSGQQTQARASKSRLKPSRFGDRSWKDLIQGKAHGTGSHRIRTYRVAIRMAKSGQYQRVHINQWLKTSSCGRVNSQLRPDVVGVRPDGKLDIIEIPHPGQTPAQMWNKIWRLEELLGELAGPGSNVASIHRSGSRA